MGEGEARALRVGVSACLLGERVRHDGGHTRDAFLTDVLSRQVEWVAVCPEVELGLGVPRPPIDLVRAAGGVRLIVATTGEDLTERMRAHAAWRARSLGPLDLDGYVLKSASPSCGLARVRVLGDAGAADAVGRGMFAQALADELPLLAMEESARLAHPGPRAHFLERLAARARWRALLRRGSRAGDLAAFHAAHKYAILARSPEDHATLTRLLTTAGRRRWPDVVDEYGATFVRAMAVRPTRARHVAVLEQIAGFFERALDHGDRADLAAALARYRRGAVPLAIPLTLLREHAHRLGVTHLTEQIYLAPPPSL